VLSWNEDNLPAAALCSCGDIRIASAICSSSSSFEISAAGTVVDVSSSANGAVEGALCGDDEDNGA
jgi:hypothetical protein